MNSLDELNSFLFGLQSEQINHLCDRLFHVQLLADHCESACSHLGKVEEVVDATQEHLTGHKDHLEKSLLGFILLRLLQDLDGLQRHI